jgi:hypothetical protein
VRDLVETDGWHGRHWRRARELAGRTGENGIDKPGSRGFPLRWFLRSVRLEIRGLGPKQRPLRWFLLAAEALVLALRL